ncbi:putative toxin-antitoxin system toxin component, PIN family [Candidatus Woesearchaeota archaeon]|nr:putative toxin-antitoxin system toxin component, PIN family [Candidatus Woesearchaeota archaeon]
MKITVDTNILVSATFWKGDPEKIITMAENKVIKLILSKDILNEYTQVLEYPEIKDKVKDKGLIVNRTIEKIISISTIVEPKDKVRIVTADSDDDKIIECAMAGKVDYIVSMDKHLLNLDYKDIPIITPSEFVKKMKK